MADDAPSELLSRRHQMFPLLSEADLARVQRFGTPQMPPRGTRLVALRSPLKAWAMGITLTAGQTSVSVAEGGIFV